MQTDARPSWLATWLQAVVVPAARRVTPVWAGAGIVAAVVFGPTAMHPRDVTRLALADPPVGIVLGVTWLLLFVPTARVLLRAEAGAFLRSLPHARAAPGIVAGVALVALQLPWLVLWLAGDGVRGLAMVALTTLLALVAATPVRRPRAVAVRGLAGAYGLALLRRAGDALVRGAGLAVLAGVAGGLVDRNNGGAPVFGAGVIAIVLVPTVSGALLALADAHRRAEWLADSAGLSRLPALAACATGVYVAAAVLAVGTAQVLVRDGELAVAVLPGAVGSGLAATRALVWADRAGTAVAARAVVGAVLVAAASVLWLGWLGIAGGAAMAAMGGVLAVTS